jgi:DNA invertase Pin-like site-specific DNA recombinase
LAAQHEAVKAFLAAHSGHVVAEFKEVESGKHNARRQLQAALKRCQQTRATLLVAKLDRLSRNAAFLLNLRESGVSFVAADLPEVNTLTLGVLAVIAQHERETISARTKAALATARARGVRLGNPRLIAGTAATARTARAALKAKAQRFAEELRETIRERQKSGANTLEALAESLNGDDVLTRRGCEWTPKAVSRVLARLDGR